MEKLLYCRSASSVRKLTTVLSMIKYVNFPVPLSQLLAGLNKPTSGSICIQRYGNSGEHKGPPEHLSPEKVGIVFQFPERYGVSLEMRKLSKPKEKLISESTVI